MFALFVIEDITEGHKMGRYDLDRVRAALWKWGKTDRRVEELTEMMKLAEKRFKEVDYEIGGSKPPDGMPRSTVPNDPIYRQYEARMRLRDVYTNEIETCSKRIAEAKNFQAGMNMLISELLPVEQDVLRERYVNADTTWEYIGFKLHMAEGTARRFEREACEKLQKKLPFPQT